MTQHALIGLVLALVVEGVHWTRLRWDFDEKSASRAWKLVLLLIFVFTANTWLDGNGIPRRQAFTSQLIWLPVLLLPMQFVQAYGTWTSMPATIFSTLAARQHARNLKHGIEDEVVRFHFGHPYFFATLLAASFGKNIPEWIFLVGALGLCLWSMASNRRHLIGRQVFFVCLCAVAAAVGREGVDRLEERFSWRGGKGTSGSDFDPAHADTLIGRARQVKLSPKIEWRITVPPGSHPPERLRTGCYDTFAMRKWSYDPPGDAGEFKELPSIDIDGVSNVLALPADKSHSLRGLPTLAIRGATEVNPTAREGKPLPLPPLVGSFVGFDNSVYTLTKNPEGVVLFDPSQSAIEGSIAWNTPDSTLESPPGPRDRKQSTYLRGDTVSRLTAELGLARNDLPLGDRLSALKLWFARHFEYTLDLTIRNANEELYPIEQFLATTRQGHCEYFATAAALMLREAGIPARYATGYAVVERMPESNDFIIRASHGHAWCRVWDADSHTWIDFDPTPGGPFSLTGTPLSFRQRVADRLQMWSEDFFLWRNRPFNKLAITIGLGLIGATLAGLTGRWLWKSRRRAQQVVGYPGGEIRRLTPLHDLERQARRILGARPPGLTYANWLCSLRSRLPSPTLLDEALALHQRLRFDPQPAAESTLAKLQEIAKELSKAIGTIPKSGSPHS